jgi:hypothetical protein
MIRDLLHALLDPVAKQVGEAARTSLDNWGRTARLAFLMITAAFAAVIYARYH